MEPRMVDYYNEMPWGINVIDEMNKELIDLQKENKELKEKLENYEKPKVLYSNIDEYSNIRNLAYNKIKEGLDKWIVEDEFEYNHMESMGLCFRQYMSLPHYIEGALNMLLKKPPVGASLTAPLIGGWESLSFKIIYGIRAFINSLIEVNLSSIPGSSLWDLVYQNTSSRELSDMLYKNIIWQLDDDSHYPCILDGIAIFRCSKCNKLTDYIDENNLCSVCDSRRAW